MIVRIDEQSAIRTETIASVRILQAAPDRVEIVVFGLDRHDPQSLGVWTAADAASLLRRLGFPCEVAHESVVLLDGDPLVDQREVARIHENAIGEAADAIASSTSLDLLIPPRYANSREWRGLRDAVAKDRGYVIEVVSGAAGLNPDRFQYLCSIDDAKDTGGDHGGSE